MKKAFRSVIALIAALMLLIPVVSLAVSPVPDALPEDLGGKTLYGYLMDLKSQYLKAKVFADAVKYSDEDRENARRACKLIILATTQKMEEAGKEDQYNLYLRGYSYDLLFQDTGDAAYQQAGLQDYQKTVALGGSYAQADYDRLAALEIKAAPLAWQVPQMLSPDEIGAILGIPGGNVMVLGTAYQTADGSRQGAGYTLRSIQDPAVAAIYVLADPQGGKARFDALKGFAFLAKSEEVPGLGDEAILLGLRNVENNPALYTTVLLRKDDLVLRVLVPDGVWRGPGFNMDPAHLAREISAKMLQNLYDDSRSLPPPLGLDLDLLSVSPVLNAGSPDSPVQDTMPADLGGKTEYGYLVEIRQKHLPANVFQDSRRSESEKNNARRAIKLIVESLSGRFDAFGLNPYELEIRGACYAAAFSDTGDPVFRMLAINDYKQAMSSGFMLPKADYDRLAAPLLFPMAELPLNTSGGYATLLQQWLLEAGYAVPMTSVLDEDTTQAVKDFEQNNGLTPDGVVDIAFLLSLYSKVDGGDAALPGGK